MSSRFYVSRATASLFQPHTMLTPERQTQMDEKLRNTPDALRRTTDIDYTEGYFFVTLNVHDRLSILGSIIGRYLPDTKQVIGAGVRLTALGEAVMRCWLDILGIDWHAMTGENKDGYHGAWTDWQHKASLRGPSLFAPGYNDTTPITAEEVATKIAYIRSNPEHRLIAGCEDDWWKK